MAEAFFRPFFAAHFAGVSAITLRGWSNTDRFVSYAAILREAEKVLQFVPEDRRVPLPQYRWGSYCVDDLVRLRIICMLRKSGWELTDALSAIGGQLLQDHREPPVKAVGITRDGEKFNVKKFWTNEEIARFVTKGLHPEILTVIPVEEIRKSVVSEIATMEDFDASEE
jgi:hypothetical protein